MKKIMLCKYMLARDTYDLRKADRNKAWKSVSLEKYDLIYLANRYSVSTALFRTRRQDKLVVPPQMIMIDVDNPDNNVEERLRYFGLHFYKVPSGSNDGWDIDYKWHYFVKLSHPLSADPAVARGQLKKFYDELGLDGYDATAIDTARYFAPGGVAEVMGTPEWDSRVIWCDQMSVEVTGNAYVPADKVNPIFASATGKSVTIDVPLIDFHPDEEWEPELDYTEKLGGGNSWILQDDTPISMGEGVWATAGAIANKLNDGEQVSNMIGCPGFNHGHEKPCTIGYGYVKRKGKTVFFNCGGNSCQGETYFLRLTNG